jgi:hypothetical protein
MKHATLGAICIAWLLLFGCSGGPEPDYTTPEKALATLIDASNRKDKDVYVESFVQAEQAGQREMSLGSPYDEVRAGRVTTEHGFTVGWEEYYMGGKKVGEQPIVFVKEDGKWKASWKASAEYREKK